MSVKKSIFGFGFFCISIFVFFVPFIYVFLMASKGGVEASLLEFSVPSEWMFFENLIEVVKARDYMILKAYLNSIIMTVGSISILVVLSAMIGYVLDRRKGLVSNLVFYFILFGLMIPPAVVPTIWLLKETYLFKTMTGMILIQVAYGLSFCVLLFKSFISSIPKDLDEAAIVDGASPMQVFFKVIFPLMMPITVTVILVQSVAIFNDFTNPLYYLPGKDNVTVQLTLYNFQSQFSSQVNLLFMNILLVTIPPLIVFAFYNKKIVSGMTAGAVKG